jgi:hypothetical protein
MHVESSFVLLTRAGLRAPLRASLGDPPECYRQACVRHRWFGYQPSPNWKLPTDEAGLRDVLACAVTREQTAEGVCARDERGGRAQTRAADAAECDGMTRLYWRTHEY